MTILLVIHAIVTIALIGTILLQRNEGGGMGLGGSNSSGNMFSARGAANLLTRITAVLVTLFFGNCLLMGALSKRQVNQSHSLFGTEDTRPQAPIEPESPMAPQAPSPAQSETRH